MISAIEGFLKAKSENNSFFDSVVSDISTLIEARSLYDQYSYDGPKGFGFPFAFYVGGGGLAYDPAIGQIGVPPYIFKIETFVLDLLIWMVRGLPGCICFNYLGSR